MRAWVVGRTGPPNSLRLRTLPDPAAGPGEVVIRVRAIGLNFADCMARLGVYPNTPPVPFVPGMEVAGEVAGVGEGVDRPEPGERVVAVPVFGGHAEKVVVPAERVHGIPDELPWAEAASFAVTGLTADWALNVVGRVRRGERVLLTAAAGGVGSMIVQMAARGGLRVLAVASTRAKRDLACSLGVERASSYEEWTVIADRWGGLDVVLDSVGGRLFRRAWRRLDRDGRYVLYGFAAAAGRRRISWAAAVKAWASMGLVHPTSLVRGCRTLAGFNLSLVPELTDELRRRFAALLREMRSGALRPVVGRRFAFGELPVAHAALQGRETVGKVVVLVD